MIILQTYKGSLSRNTAIQIPATIIQEKRSDLQISVRKKPMN